MGKHGAGNRKDNGDNSASFRRMRTATQKRTKEKSLSAINVLKRSKTPEFDGLPAELLIAALAIFADHLLSLIRKTL